MSRLHDHEGVRHEQEFERIFIEGTDYGELLARREIRRQVEDIDEWRAEIRRQARRDRVRVRTFVLNEERGTVLAVITNPQPTDEDLRRVFRLISLENKAKVHAEELGHKLNPWTRRGDQAGTVCRACSARLLVALSANEELVEGEAVEEPCVWA